MDRRGGFRPGSGRKKGYRSARSVAEGDARTVLVQKVLEDWEPIIETMKEVALGETKYIKIVNQEERIYTKPPNASVLAQLLEFVVGKPKQDINSTVNMPQLEELTKEVRDILNPKKP